MLWRHSLQTLGLGLLTMGLTALAPLLQLRAGLPDRPIFTLAMLQVATLPLELYFIPRLMLQLDAEAINAPQNLLTDWKATFETRWLKTFGAKLLLSLIVALGASCFVFPGLLVIVIFGWMPLRVLLRGETIGEGFRESARLMARAWPRVVSVSCVVIGVFLLATLLLAAPTAKFLPEPTLQQRITHPIIWASNFGAGLLSLWISAAFLALFHRVENPEENYLP